MSRIRQSTFNIDELALAYRKAKVDLYYSNDPRPLDLLEYEENLAENLERLLSQLNGRGTKWVEDEDFLGTFTVIPKRVTLAPERAATVQVSRLKAWHNGEKRNSQATFRLFSRCSIDMHVIGALWVGRVGASMDAVLDKSVRGYRLRRTASHEYNWYSSGSFEPYLAPYRRWQDDGFRVMEEALQAGEQITTVIADASSFFHNIDPSFLDETAFLDRMGVDISRADRRLHKLFTQALLAWRARMSELTGVLISGLPLGYPASAVVANLAMLDFDHTINTRVRPRYYGRYVDDIILVLDGGEALHDSESTWQWLSDQFAHVPGIQLNATRESCVYSTDYLGESRIEFGNEKNRVLLMEGEEGLSLIKAIRKTIAERSSEWRAMPQLPANPEEVGPGIVRALRPDGSAADSLRTAEQMTTSRALFALTVRDFEAFTRDIDPDSWSAQRKAFYTAIRHHILVPQVALDMDAYISRILRIAIHCEDWDELIQLVNSVVMIYQAIGDIPAIELKSAPADADLKDSVIHAWGRRIRRSITEALVTTATHGVRQKVIDEIKSELSNLPADNSGPALRPKTIETMYQDLLVRDLAYEPFRVQLLPEEIRPTSLGRLTSPAAPATHVPVPNSLVQPLRELADALEKVLEGPTGLEGHPALVFPTRPLAALEVFAITRVLSPLTGGAAEDFAPWLLATRGFVVEDTEEVIQSEGDRWVIHLPRDASISTSGRARVAVTMLEIEEQSWMSSLHGRPDRSGARYRRVAELVDSILSSRVRPDYVLLPELALPAAWFVGVARKLAGRGISLISGVEYLHEPNGRVRNQVWASLVTDVLGFTAPVLYRQDKQCPAPHERRLLASVPPTPLELTPAISWESPPLIQHGSNMLALLVCSELTNIGYRASLRGKIDVLFVPEWNQDLHTFEPLVEGGALDMHAYIVQANNRAFGDSRVRAPRSEQHERDVARVRGGMNDYFVVVELDIKGLRSFQSQVSALNGPFKPLPDGFKLDKRRRLVPKV